MTTIHKIKIDTSDAADGVGASSGEHFASAPSAGEASAVSGSVASSPAAQPPKGEAGAKPAAVSVAESGEKRTVSAAEASSGAGAEGGEAEQKPRWYKRPFIHKLGYGLLSLLIAVTIWGYVLMSENPVRIKRVDNVRLSIDGGSEASFLQRNLIVVDDLTSLLPTVSVNVETRLNDLARFDSATGNVVTAYINLNDIRGPGIYERQISAVSTVGTPVSIEPKTVTITVENNVTRTIPVTYSIVGELPAGYWHGEAALPYGDTISLSGAESKIRSIVRANCVIDLTGRTSEINESFEPVLLDEDQNVLDKTGIVGVMPSVIIRMPVMPYTEIQVDKYIAFAGEINENYELSSLSINPGTLSVAAPREVLDTLESSIYIEPINVANLYPGTHQQRVSVMGLASEARLLSDNNFIVTIVIADKHVTRSLSIPKDDVEIEGEDHTLFNYLYGTNSFSVQFSGPARIVNALRESDVHLYLNVRSFLRGTHEITPKLSIAGDPAWLYDGSVEITVQKSFCTVTTATS